MAEIVFGGFVWPGIGQHSELHVPGRAELPTAPPDWPEKLHPGSLNVRVRTYPPEFQSHGLSDSVHQLDLGRFVGAFEILRDEFGNNQLRPRPDCERRGDAQVWRAFLLPEQKATRIECWALRRFGSGVGEVLEFVADRRLRDHGLEEHGTPVTAFLIGDWRI